MTTASRHPVFKPARVHRECWRCGSAKSERRILKARVHTTHHDFCDCRIIYTECVNRAGCRRRERTRT
jgi:hypothetical protein